MQRKQDRRGLGCQVGGILVAAWLCVALPLPSSIVAKASEKENDWPATMLRLRALSSSHEAPRVQLGPWYTTGPLKASSFSDSLFPEKGVSLEAREASGRRLWRREPGWVDGEVRSLPGGGGASTYIYRSVKARESVRLDVSLGSDDGLEVFLRGRKVLSRDVARGPAPDQDKLTLDLKKGENGLLLKIYNRGGGHGYYFSAGGDPYQDSWRKVEKLFPQEASWMRKDSGGRHVAWFLQRDKTTIEKQMISRVLRQMGREAKSLRKAYNGLKRKNPPADDPRWLSLYARCARLRAKMESVVSRRDTLSLEPLRLAVQDLADTFGAKYPRGPEFLKRLDALQERLGNLPASGEDAPDAAADTAGLLDEIETLKREALLSNPLLDFDRLLLVKRSAGRLGLPQNWQGNCALPRNGYDNEIAVLSPPGPDGKLETLYRPEKDYFVGDVDLHFDAGRMLFSMPGSHERWQIWEIDSKDASARQVTPGTFPDVDNYDACYLPDGRIIFASTRCFQGVPCVGGSNTVANLCIMNQDGTGIRQVCFDQDHDWCPTVLNDGRVLYSRWEYSDIPHYFSRLLFHMNPDGTNQMEFYASNSMWPNSIFYARPVPGSSTKVIAVISGHHGVPRMGELVLFDAARGRHEADGAVQRIPGRGRKVEPVIKDQLVSRSWPRFLHPYPLSDKYFLVSCQPTPKSLWGIYLVDVFDNFLLLKEVQGYALLEPLPFRKTARPPAIPDRVDLKSREAIVYLSDVYAGKGLRDVPRGAVKKLRVYSLHYAYPRMGGHINIGIDGPWDGRRILGTVNVEKDGSAQFVVPANTPIAVQPLDSDGMALQLMRSWFTAMPGEKLSCVGCHESQNSTVAPRYSLAARQAPSRITPWYGPARGFSFKREVQPTLNRYCVGCHNSKQKKIPDFSEQNKHGWRNFTPSYVALHPFVRRPGPESDYFMQQPLEFHASTSELIQILRKGHHGVKLDREGWDRLITWIDLNVPDHGTWHEERNRHSPFEKRRLEMRTLFANRPEDPEAIVQAAAPPAEPVIPTAQPASEPASGAAAGSAPAWAFDAEDARKRREAAGLPAEMKIELSPEVSMRLVLIPAGEFAMGSASGAADELPVTRVKCAKPFWLGVCEVTNAQYAVFDPRHDSAYISMTNKDQNVRGFPVNASDQPVVRITWKEAMEFCRWLSRKTHRRFTLPTEAQWEWACRAGTSTPFSYGDLDSDFSRFANLADSALAGLARRDSPKWHPRDGRFRDGAMVSARVGSYQPNAWGLHDMHGNVAEWTRSAYVPYPFSASREPGASDLVVARGGSWYDRPARARSAFRLPYRPWQRVFNVGFRVLLEADGKEGTRISFLPHE